LRLGVKRKSHAKPQRTQREKTLAPVAPWREKEISRKAAKSAKEKNLSVLCAVA
jgi:hypothetical protein